MKDLRTNKTQLYIIIECVCEDGTDDIDTFIFDNKKSARERFKNLIEEDKKFLAEEGRNDIIEEHKNSYCSFPEGRYSTTHYWVNLLTTKNA